MADATVCVLAVDDDRVNLAYVREALAQAGADVTATADASAALALARQQCFDLVLCDLRMPVLDGEAFLRALRADGASADARVIVMSADLPPAEATRLRAAGFADALAKPVPAATLVALVGCTAVAAPAAAVADAAVLDDEHALRTLGSSDAMHALRALLADELPTLRAALGAAGATERRELLHRLIGGAELCGALQLAHAARACRHAASGTEADLQDAFDATLAALRAS